VTPEVAGAAIGAELSLADLAASWRNHLEAERKARGTVRAYLSGVEAFTAWHEAQAPGLPVVASSLDRKTASAFLADLLGGGTAPATARLRYQALRQFAAWLAAEGETETDLLLGSKPPRLDKRRVDSLAPDEVTALIRACRAPAGAGRWTVFEALRDEAILRLIADTGMRAGEVLALTVDDVDLKRRLVTVTRAKGGKHRLVAFSAETARAIDRYLRRARRHHRHAALSARLWLPTANRAGPWSYHALRGALAKRAEAAEVKAFHPHRLRHTAASAALDAGMAEGDVLAAFGWSSRQMLDRYVEDTAQRRAAANFARYFDERDGR
jgi:integrase/recombinase XerD